MHDWTMWVALGLGGWLVLPLPFAALLGGAMRGARLAQSIPVANRAARPTR